MMDLTRMRKGPLPGGRQGASGAGAGRDSMRTASQRAQGTARPPSSPSHPSSPPAGLVSAGSSRAQRSAPATGGARHMRWTTQMNSNQAMSTFDEAILETRSTPPENRPRLPRIALSKRNRAIVRALNPMLVTYLEASRDLCETDSILFGAALAVCRIIGAKLSTAGRTTGQSSAIPAWRTRIEERIARARALIGRLICFRSGNTRLRIVRTIRMAFAGINVSLSQPDIMQKLTERIDDLKQRIAAWEKRIRRYTERSTRFNQNRLFQSGQKRLYKSLERPMVSGTGPVLNQADTVAFWRSLWSEPINHNDGPWTEVVASQCAGITSMDPVIITPDDVAEAVRRAPNWKTHYWLKGFMIVLKYRVSYRERGLERSHASFDVCWRQLTAREELSAGPPPPITPLSVILSPSP
ncbi:unnamed protein product [Parnassius apollo]|uniref:(apollo) hypothetical protein n=1 Tax=Parnassius apollo TaxID=110799 RepID=A0A8S3WQL0_PARAO|nr:unnamed protein product [Parnassius apollo]